MVQPVFSVLVWLVGGALLAVVALVGGSIRIGRQMPGAGPLVVIGPALLLGSTVLGGFAGLAQVDRTAGVAAALLLRLCGALAALPIFATAALVLTVMAFADGTRPGGRHAAAASWLLGIALLTLVEGMIGGNPVFGVFRAGAVVMVGGTALLALGGRPPLGIGAAVLVASTVGILEGASRAVVGFLALHTSIDRLPPELRGEGVRRMLAHVAPEVPYGVAALGLAVVGVLVVSGPALRRRATAPALLALAVALGVAAAAHSVGLPSEVLLVGAAEQAP